MKTRQLFIFSDFIYLDICIFYSVDLFEKLHIGPLQKVMQVFAQKKDLVDSRVLHNTAVFCLHFIFC